MTNSVTEVLVRMRRFRKKADREGNSDYFQDLAYRDMIKIAEDYLNELRRKARG